jgi:hypothetical protein
MVSRRGCVVSSLIKMSDELVLFTLREYYKLASVTRMAYPVKNLLTEVARENRKWQYSLKCISYRVMYRESG